MSQIIGVNDGHMWKRGETANVGSNYLLKCTHYSCANCGSQFNHRYDLVPNIVQAMRMEGVPEQCEKANITDSNG